MFSDTRAADRISARTWPQLTLHVEGPGAKALKHAPNNLSLAAAMALRDAADRTGLGAALTLHKELPIAGGGDSGCGQTIIVRGRPVQLPGVMRPGGGGAFTRVADNLNPHDRAFRPFVRSGLVGMNLTSSGQGQAALFERVS